MYANGYNNNLLICFVENYSNLLIALEFDPENDLSFINNTINNKENEGTYDIKTIISPNKQICLICYTKANFECILYDSKRKLFGGSVILYESFQGIYSDFDLNYVKDTNEYYIYVAPSTEKILFFRYDEYFKIKEKSNDNNCYTKYTINNCQRKYSSVILYYKDNYSIFYSCGFHSEINSNNETLGNCNNTFSENNYGNFNMDISFSTSSIPSSSSIPLLYSSALLSTTIPISSHISSTYFSTFSSEIFSTSFTPSTYSSNNLFLTSIIQESTTISSLNSLLSSSIPYTSLNKLIRTNNDYSFVYFYNISTDIIEGIITLNIKDLQNNIDNLINIIEIGQNYYILGDEYNISIKPIDEKIPFENTYIDFSECKEILKNKHSLSSDEILTILQIEINKMNEKSLINQVEYAIFSENKKN